MIFGLFFGGHDVVAFLTSRLFQHWTFGVPLDGAELRPLMHTDEGNGVGANTAAMNDTASMQWRYREVYVQSMGGTIQL